MNETESSPRSFSPFTILDPIIHRLPEVRPPTTPVPLKRKLMWSGAALVVFFIMGEITIYGVDQQVQDYLSFFKSVLASESGTLITLGIGPIVAASILMQLFQGAEIFNFDLTSHEGRARYQGTQKMLALFLCFFEAAVYIFAGAFGSYNMGQSIFMTLQVGFGATLVLLMDEVVTKWGFGSGVSLFIAGGVSKDIIWKLFSVQPSSVQDGQLIGAIPGFIQSLIKGNPILLRGDLPDMMQVAFTLGIFVLVIYFETLWVDVPLSMGRFTGRKGGYPVKLIYTSVIPVILTMSIFGTYQLFARSITSRFGVSLLGQFDATGDVVGGIMYYLSPPRGIFEVASDPLRAAVYLTLVIILCALFAMLWADITGMDSKAVAQKIQQAGMQVAGYKRDIRVIESVLNRYIPQVIVMGGAAVGVLAVIADFTNALGTGTGILLAVSIMYRMYQDLLRDPELPDRVREMLT